MPLSNGHATPNGGGSQGPHLHVPLSNDHATPNGGDSQGPHVHVPLSNDHVTPNGGDSQGTHVPLTGLGVGNGLTAPEIQYKYYSEMAYKNSARPLVSKTVYEAMKLSSAACLAEIRMCQDKDEACNAAFELCALTQVQISNAQTLLK